MLTLFATKTCPNCKMAKKMLDEAGLTYNVIYADENPEAAKHYKVKMAPTLLVSETERYENASKIKAYINSLQ